MESLEAGSGNPGEVIQCEVGDCALTIGNGPSGYLLAPERPRDRWANTWGVGHMSCRHLNVSGYPLPELVPKLPDRLPSPSPEGGEGDGESGNRIKLIPGGSTSEPHQEMQTSYRRTRAPAIKSGRGTSSASATRSNTVNVG